MYPNDTMYNGGAVEHMYMRRGKIDYKRGPGFFCSRRIWVQDENCRRIDPEILLSTLKIHILASLAQFCFPFCGVGPLCGFTVLGPGRRQAENTQKFGDFSPRRIPGFFTYSRSVFQPATIYKIPHRPTESMIVTVNH